MATTLKKKYAQKSDDTNILAGQTEIDTWMVANKEIGETEEFEIVFVAERTA